MSLLLLLQPKGESVCAAITVLAVEALTVSALAADGVSVSALSADAMSVTPLTPC